MKKIFKGFLVILMSLLVASCSENINTSETGNKDGKTIRIDNGEAKEEPRQEVKVNDVIEKAVEIADSLTSYTIELDMEQTMGNVGNEMSTKAKTIMHVVTDPLSLYEKMDMTLTINGESKEIGTEAYYTPDGLYMSDSISQQWMKLSDDLLGTTFQTNANNNIVEQMKLLHEFMDSIKMEQDSSQYVLTIKGNDVSYAKLVNALALSNVDEEVFLMIGNMTIEQFEYILYFDKSNYYPIKTEIKTVVTFSENGESTTLNQTIIGTYSNYNEFDKIEIPEEVINNVVEF